MVPVFCLQILRISFGAGAEIALREGVTLEREGMVQGLTRVAGIISPCDWDEAGNPTQLQVCTPGEIDFTLEDNDVSRQLYDHVQRTMVLFGTIYEVDDDKYFKVFRFEAHIKP